MFFRTPIQKNHNLNLKTIISNLSYDDISSRLDTVFYNPEEKTFNRNSYFLSNNTNEFVLRDVISSTFDLKYGIMKKIKSSFIDVYPHSILNKKSKIITEIIDESPNISNIDSKNKIERNSIQFDTNKKMYIYDNNTFLDTLDILVDYYNLNDKELSIFYFIFILTTFPLIHFPIFFNGIIDFDKNKIQLNEIKTLKNDSIEIETLSKKTINDFIYLYSKFQDYIRQTISESKRSFIIFFYVNYFETVLQIREKNLKTDQLVQLTFNPSDFYRILRLFGEVKNIDTNFYKDLIISANKVNLNDISSLYYLTDIEEYFLEYFGWDKENQRREDKFDF